MRQSKNINDRDKTIAIYLRISREDSRTDESYSIANQRKLLTDVAKKMGFINLLYFVDDGITGTSRDRKEFSRMLTELEKGYISTVVVKDLSRFARDHIRADILIEETFPENDIRLISVSEGLDTANGEDDFTPFRNLMNEWYARDISKKRKLTNVVKGNSGIPLSLPPYGYMQDANDPKRWVIDEDAARVVRSIFEMFIDGKGTMQIADTLSSEKILTPTHYWRQKGVRRPARASDTKPWMWSATTVIHILSAQEYCGDIINFKTYSKSFKLKKRIPNSVENMAIFRDVHEPIVERKMWETVQKRRESKRRRKAKDGVKNMFSGLLVCANCGSNLWYHFNQKNPDIKYFNCSGYNSGKGICNTTHYIRVDFLEKVVLQEIKRLTRYARQHETKFATLVMGHHEHSTKHQGELKQKELSAMTKRDKEIDVLFSKMYEDNVSGKLDDERFRRMSTQYSLEQKDLAEKIKTLSLELERDETSAASAEMFLSTVHRYTRAQKLTERMLNELIDRIEVHHRKRVNGQWEQKLTIHYNFIGALEIPETLSLPEIVTKTRKGVTLSYSPLKQAM
jgi:DNA invertase Pin-like site-specific DNA recombinase